jgi:hypothetical protein
MATRRKGRDRKAAKTKQPGSIIKVKGEDSSIELKVTGDAFKSSGISSKDYKTLSSFSQLKGEERVATARAIIAASVIVAKGEPDARFAAAVAESESLLPGYATLDGPHRDEIKKLIEQITDYLRDTTRQRPLNALMLAAPGAGKSHFIRELARKMKGDRVQAVTFNMATMRSADDMAQPVDELRNLKVNDRFPLLFFG